MAGFFAIFVAPTAAPSPSASSDSSAIWVLHDQLSASLHHPSDAYNYIHSLLSPRSRQCLLRTFSLIQSKTTSFKVIFLHRSFFAIVTYNLQWRTQDFVSGGGVGQATGGKFFLHGDLPCILNKQYIVNITVKSLFIKNVYY